MLDKRCKLKLKKGYTEKDLEKYGFENGMLYRIKNDIPLYRVVCSVSGYIQIQTFGATTIAGRLQCFLYDLIVDGIVEKVYE